MTTGDTRVCITPWPQLGTIDALRLAGALTCCTSEMGELRSRW
jgi:hypothetical protein